MYLEIRGADEGVLTRHGLFAGKIFAGKIFAGNSNGNLKLAGNLPAKTANFSLCDMYHTKLLKSN